MPIWSKEKLKERTARRIAAHKPFAEQAALAWARWKGMTDEIALDRNQAKSELDRLVDTMEPEQWQTIYALAGTADDNVMRGVLLYSIERGSEQAREMAQALVEPTPDNPPPPKPSRKQQFGM